MERGWVDGVFGGLTVSLEFADCPALRTRLRVRRHGRWEFVERVCTCGLGGHQSRSIIFLSFTPKCAVLCADYRCRNNSSTPRLPSDLFSHATRQAAPTLPLCPTSPRDPPSSSQLPLLCLTLTLPPPRQIIFN